MKTCSVCTTPVYVKGFCRPHYAKNYKYGNPLFYINKRAKDAIIKIYKDYAEIELTSNKFSKIDLDDLERIKQRKWSFSNGYANSTVEGKAISMHRFIMEVTDSKIYVDHINHDTLDNRRSNLRKCGNAENQHNSIKHRDNTSGYKGVYWNKVSRKWTAYINIKKKGKHLGGFDNKEDAARAYDSYAREMFGEFANTNFENICVSH